MPPQMTATLECCLALPLAAEKGSSKQHQLHNHRLGHQVRVVMCQGEVPTMTGASLGLCSISASVEPGAEQGLLSIPECLL